MANLIRITDAIDVAPFLEEVEKDPLAWLDDITRQNQIKCQRHTQSIRLRTSKKGPLPPQVHNTQNVQECHTLQQYRNYPVAWKFCSDYTTQQNGILGWVSYIKLNPQSQVYPHRDNGIYYDLRDRYHLVVKSANGTVIRAGGQTVTMYPGEFWVFNNKLEHEVHNPSDEDRIHLIFDLLPNPGQGYFTNLTVNIAPDNPGN